MLLTEDYCPPISFQQQHRHQPYNNLVQSTPRGSTTRGYAILQQTSPFTASEADFDAENNTHSIASSPASTQSLLSQFSGTRAPVAGFDSLPTIALLREAQQPNTVLDLSNDAPLFTDHPDLMQADLWSEQLMPVTPRTAVRFSSMHNRESSLSSLGSVGPASPYSHNTTNPQIAIADSNGELFHGLPMGEDLTHYQLAPKALQGQDAFMANYPNYANGGVNNAARAQYPATNGNMTNNRGRQTKEEPRGLLPPPPDFAAHQNNSQSASVASSVTSESPLTPSGEADEERRRKIAAFKAVPKLDRTLTDIYGDELFFPQHAFSQPSASPSHMAMAPTNNKVFAQRLQDANSQHLSVVHSPVTASPLRDRSPFQEGSPHAPTPTHDFGQAMPQAIVFGSAQQLREQRKAAQDAQAVQQQLARSSNMPTTQTISPKDALLEYHPQENEANMPLFPQHEQAPTHHMFGSNDFASSAALAANMQVPQQYSYNMGTQHNGRTPLTNGLLPSRLNSGDTAQSSNAGSTPERPTSVSADGGTYTCTYHGCTQRFDTPQLLQKHKREGHRQNGLTTVRRPDSAGDGMTSTFLNTQHGPHKCERINPSTGRPCNTIFSRPYDLTRHEDTIHNARKKKVHCDLCTEEKTFSRGDALTRHYRVCHPDHEFPGKRRRRVAH